MVLVASYVARRLKQKHLQVEKEVLIAAAAAVVAPDVASVAGD